LNIALYHIKENGTGIITLAYFLHEIRLKTPILLPFWFLYITTLVFTTKVVSEKNEAEMVIH